MQRVTVGGAIILAILLLAGCARHAARNVDTTAADMSEFARLSAQFAASPSAEGQAAVDRIRRQPRLQVAMQSTLYQIGRVTIDMASARDDFIQIYRARPEVRLSFAVQQSTPETQDEVLEQAWMIADGWRRNQIEGEAQRVKDEAARRQAEIDRAEADKKRQADELAAAKAQAEEETKLTAEAKAGSRIHCSNEAQCKKAFSLAQIYINKLADMKIQVATDTIIETYNPTEAGKIGLSVVKTPGAGQSAEIVISTTCKECRWESKKMSLLIMKGFRPYIESTLKN